MLRLHYCEHIRDIHRLHYIIEIYNLKTFQITRHSLTRLLQPGYSQCYTCINTHSSGSLDVPSSPVHNPVQQLDIATDITCAKLTYSRLTHMEMPCVQNVPDNCKRVEYIKHSSYSIYQSYISTSFRSRNAIQEH